MVCNEYKCIFVHIPKVAGQSVEHVFLNLLGLTWANRSPLLLRSNDNPDVGPPSLAHLKASEYTKYGYVTDEKFNSYFKFSFVRNPWDRIVSEYRYRGFPKECDFKTYLFKKLPDRAWSDHYCHVTPQYKFLFDDKGDRLVDFVGKFESLQKDFDTVCESAGIPVTLLPHANTSSGRPGFGKNIEKSIKSVLHLKEWENERRHTFKHYMSYYDDEAREFVGELYKKDAELFSYKFGD